MNYLIKIIKISLIVFILFLMKNLYAGSLTKIIFILKDKAYTNIDVENRTNYLKLKEGRISIDDKYIKKDFISALIFSEFSEGKIKLQDSLINKYYNEFFLKYEDKDQNQDLINILSLIDKNQIKIFLEMDIRRKIILEDLLNNKEKNKYKIKDNISIVDIYKIDIEFYSINIKDKDKINNNNIKIDFLDKNQTNNILLKNKIDYIFEKKENININSINKYFKQAFKNNKDYVVFEMSSNIIYGKITKSIKFENEIRVNLIEIQNINENEIENLTKNDCSSIINNNKDNVNIKEFIDIKFIDLNLDIKNNLKKINDTVYFKNNTRITLIKLCDIKYDKEFFKNYKINSQIGIIVNEIEKKFTDKYSKVYKLTSQNE